MKTSPPLTKAKNIKIDLKEESLAVNITDKKNEKIVYEIGKFYSKVSIENFKIWRKGTNLNLELVKINISIWPQLFKFKELFEKNSDEVILENSQEDKKAILSRSQSLSQIDFTVSKPKKKKSQSSYFDLKKLFFSGNKSRSQSNFKRKFESKPMKKSESMRGRFSLKKIQRKNFEKKNELFSSSPPYLLRKNKQKRKISPRKNEKKLNKTEKKIYEKRAKFKKNFASNSLRKTKKKSKPKRFKRNYLKSIKTFSSLLKSNSPKKKIRPSTSASKFNLQKLKKKYSKKKKSKKVLSTKETEYQENLTGNNNENSFSKKIEVQKEEIHKLVKVLKEEKDQRELLEENISNMILDHSNQTKYLVKIIKNLIFLLGNRTSQNWNPCR